MHALPVRSASRKLPSFSFSFAFAVPFAFAFAFATTVSSVAAAHIVMTSPTPRDDQAHKDGPCGGLSMGNTPAVFKAGQQVDITWDETIDHTGCFVLEVSTSGDDKNFQPLMTVQDPANAPKGYTQKVTMPNATCAKCTFRVRQLMGADPATCGPTTVPTDGTYFACADIRIDPIGGSGGTDAGPTSKDGGTGANGSDAGSGGGTGTGMGGTGTGAGTGGGVKGTDGGTGPTSSAASGETAFADTGCGVAGSAMGSGRRSRTAFGSLALMASSLLVRRRRRQSR